jgi:pimeloyl-ACP methyl ester carboxylesterase
MRCVFVAHHRVVSKTRQNSLQSLGNELGAQMKHVANDVRVIVLPNTGHGILEQRPKETTDALLEFL